jgi:ribosome-associated protein
METKTVKQLSSRERALHCAAFALEKKGIDVRVLDISRISSIADFLVLATGNSDKQVQAMADSVRKGLKKFGKVQDVEGLKEGKWVVMDYGDVLVHIFVDELRRYYDLDRLWEDAPEVEVPADYLQQEEKK